jgi:hypothetical protein
LSTTPLSSVPVQFLIQVVGSSTCGIPPKTIGTPEENSCTAVIVGQTFESTLIATTDCNSSTTIVDIATLSFAYMDKGTIVAQNPSTYIKTLSWIPSSTQVGY